MSKFNSRKVFGRYAGHISMFIISILLVSLTANVFAQDSEYEKKFIKKVEFEGIVKKTAGELLEKIDSRPNTFYRASKLQEDVKTLYKIGCFSDINVDVSEEDNNVIIKFIVKEQVLVTKILIEGEKECNEHDIKEVLPFKEDDFYNQSKVKEGAVKIKAFYDEKGYFLAKVSTEENKEEKGMMIIYYVEEGRRMWIDKINIIGAKAISEDEIKGQMETKQAAFLVGGKYEEKKFREDLNKIVNYCKEKGFANAKVLSHEIKFDDTKEKIYININIEEGKKYTVSSINYNLVEHGQYTKDEISNLVEIKPGDIFNQRLLEKSLMSIRSYYSEGSYIHTMVIPKIEFNESDNSVDITVIIQEGIESIIEEIMIEGNYKTKDKVILRELKIKAGEPFNSAKIRRSMERLYNLGFFDEVMPDVLPGSEEGKDKLLFHIKEKKWTGEASVGMGYSSLEGLTGNIGITEHNFLGNGQTISANAQFGGVTRNYELSFADPWFLDTSMSFGANIFYTLIGYYSYYKDLRYGGSIRTGHYLDEEFIRLWLTYKLQAVDIYDVEDTASDYVKQSAGKRTTSSISSEIVFDTRDLIIFNTTKGYRLSGYFELAGLGGDIFYTRYILDGSYFIKTFWQFVLAFHANAGYITGFGPTPGVPFYERFFMGGTRSVRGYDERAIGPKDSGGFPLGGRFASFANIEYRMPLVDKVLLAALFFDAGGTWDKAESARTDEIATGAGFGLRISIPGTVFLLRLEYGYGFDERWRVPGGKIHFEFGSIF